MSAGHDDPPSLGFGIAHGGFNILIWVYRPGHSRHCSNSRFRGRFPPGIYSRPTRRSRAPTGANDRMCFIRSRLRTIHRPTLSCASIRRQHRVDTFRISGEGRHRKNASNFDRFLMPPNYVFEIVVPRVGFELTTYRLRSGCSTAELPGRRRRCLAGSETGAKPFGRLGKRGAARRRQLVVRFRPERSAP